MRADLGLLLLRITAGGMMLLAHGWPKLLNFSILRATFPDPVGLGSTISLTLAVFAEVFCAAAVLVGFQARWAALPVAGTMAVAGFIHHFNDPWSRKEMALIYLGMFLVIFLLGAGSLSIDGVMGRNRRN